jgi:hypothetical protein
VFDLFSHALGKPPQHLVGEGLIVAKPVSAGHHQGLDTVHGLASPVLRLYDDHSIIVSNDRDLPVANAVYHSVLAIVHRIPLPQLVGCPGLVLNPV